MPNPSSKSTGNPQLNYQYNYNYGYGPDDPQHRQLHRIWETGPEGELLINRSNNLMPSSSDADAVQATGHVFLDVYLPNGLLLPIQCPLQRTLALLKQDVFIQARKYPLSNRILDISNYIFSTIGLDGAYVELYDEQKTVSSLQFLFLPFLILIEPVGNKTEKELNQNIGFVMGITLKELERSIGEELQHYRLKLFESCLEAQTQRGTQSFLHYAFPEEPLLHHEVSIQRNQHFGEISEKDLEYQELSEKPEEVQRRAMEKLRQKMQFSDAYIEVWYGTKLSGTAASTTQADEQFKYSVRIRNVLEMKLDGVIAAALRELRLQHGLEIPQQPSDFILQIAGKRVFITRSDVFLTQFDYIRSCFENYRIPRLIIRKKKLVFSDYPPPPPIFEPSYVRREKHNQYLKSELSRGAENIVAISSSQQNTKQFWDLDENLRIRIHSVSNITVKDVTDRFFIRVAVAVGRHVLDVKESPTITPSNPRWAQETFIDFDVYMKDLPQCVQLCFSLISLHSSTNPAESAKSRKQRAAASSQTTPSKADQVQPLGWANIHLFDWRNRLIQGKQTLSLQAFGKEEIRSSYASGQEPLQFIHFENFVDSSAATMARGPKLEIEMIEYFGNSTIIEYPSNAVIQRYIAWLKQQRRHRAGSREEDSEEEQDDIEQQQQQVYEDCRQKGGQKLKQLPGPDLIRLFQLRRCLDSAQLTEDDQSFLWRVRYRIRRLFPQMLPVLADCALIWRDRETSSEFYHLLAEWPLLHVDTAIELLDGRYVDARLREMAVQHLDAALDDDQLQLYLLILVQAIRFEPHAHSPLIRMLLTRSLMDYRVGHTLFWLLRAELAHLQAINQPASSNMSSTTLSPLFTRFALLLEAYCRGNSAHLRSMIKQVEMISILTALSADIRACGNKETANKKLQQELLARKEQMQHMVSPVNATDRLGELIIEECRVLSSAKQPLLLTWRNPEILAELTAPTHQLIFKCGDDMRQDMLSLHVMRIMDAKWKCQLQQDFCMTLYEVLPMGKNIGLIHVVPECQTLFQIQCEAKRTASLNMDVALLNKYIYKKCCSSDSKKYLECVDRFTFSLAGYCVATYVLGIKDRHQDNIMLAKDGRIFHIDFGHFLGHTKRKLGINRERTDFILTDHFLYVISRGKSNVRQTYEYTSFREECIKGFLVLHNQARFFIALFRMMCCMGLPELNSPENVDFLRQSLMYEKVERGEARASFEQIFEDVVRGDWSVQLNWFFHSVRHM